MTVRSARLIGAFGAILVVLSTLASPASTRTARAQSAGEIRALWVDAFNDGIKSQAQVDKLVADARRANVNTLLVQVRRNADVYYLGGPEPLANDLPAGFDPLRAVLAAARASSPRLEVHAVIPVYRIWNDPSRPPAHPNHLFNRHGPTAQGTDNWLMMRDDGEFWTGQSYWLDPGHPAVQAYIVELLTDLVRRYDVDGVQLDRIRYFEGASSGGVRDRRWGYNPASVIRFDLENGRVGNPDPNDPAWIQYRRDRVTEQVQRIRDAVIAVRPTVKLSAAVIPWGSGPTSQALWQRSAAYADVFQDWRTWLEQGLLDQAYLMAYNRESAADQAVWLDQWLTFLRANGHGRHVVAGLGIFLNTPSDSLRQVRRALSPDSSGSRLAGVALFSYANPDASRVNDNPADDSPDGFLWDVLARPAPENDFSPPFAEPVAVPSMTWRQ